MEDIVDTFLVRVAGSPDEPFVDAHMLRRLRKKMARILNKCRHQRKIAGAIEDMNKRVEEVAARRDRDILVDFDYMNPNLMVLDERQLSNEPRKLIQNKRCFFVIDDIWNTKSWELIRCALQHGNFRSRVVVTTGIFEVTTHIGDIYKMQPLSRDDSKLYSRITDGEDRFLDSLSTEACDKILKKCGGVPLAIIIIASLLAGKSGEDWSKVYNSIGFGERGNDIVENTRLILSFSYYDLPSHLKACLMYLCLFREEYGIEKNLLIWKWIAEGFIQNEQATTEIGFFELGEGEEKFATILDSDGQQKLMGSNARRLAVHDVTVHVVQEQDMETLGRLPELCYLKLSSDYTRLVSIRKTSGDLRRYFRKLRFFLTPFSSVQFDLHGCKSDASIAPSIMMPSLESLVFSVYVRFLKDVDMQLAGFYSLLGFEKVAAASLQRLIITDLESSSGATCRSPFITPAAVVGLCC
ncbi:hypothetical protein BAE44_0015157 [Dichanthelium oligosanthes]|uniref:Uncharacterized protein n=1 Tax=Dichanthelium oligosanthes TaxID=888268 RepID=A0A1E5VFL3_9POAL|nr:hypothetical protein BAE44_0015157 [Dichanthelium oligosanthes]